MKFKTPAYFGDEGKKGVWRRKNLTLTHWRQRVEVEAESLNLFSLPLTIIASLSSSKR